MKGEEKEEENASEKIMYIIKCLNLGSILFQALRPCH